MMAIKLHTQSQAGTSKLDARWLWHEGTEKISLIAELVEIPKKDVSDCIKLHKVLKSYLVSSK